MSIMPSRFASAEMYQDILNFLIKHEKVVHLCSFFAPPKQSEEQGVIMFLHSKKNHGIW
jgi:hypothetical protein